jgi:hypothetical protein
MSKSDETVSGAEQDEQSTDSVLDFLYHDVRRVGSFLAQFDYFGHLQQITATDSASKGAKRGYSLKIGGTVPVPGSVDGAEGSLTFGRDPSVAGSESQARVYDPLWTNALALLDYLDERTLIQRDIANARIGQFVLVTGGLTFLDLRLLNEILEVPQLKTALIRGIAKIPEVNTSEIELKTPEKRAEFVLGILRLLPTTLQFTLDAKPVRVWGTLEENSITGSPTSMALSHGETIPGEWSVVGILDGLPDAGIDISQTAAAKDPAPLKRAMGGMANIARKVFGRPADTYSVTPLLIYRKVSG